MSFPNQKHVKPKIRVMLFQNLLFTYNNITYTLTWKECIHSRANYKALNTYPAYRLLLHKAAKFIAHF